MFYLCFLLQRVDVRFFQPGFRSGGSAVGFELMGTMGGLYQPPAALGCTLQLVRGLHAHIIILTLLYFPMKLGKNKVCRRVLYRMGQLGGRFFLVHFLKSNLCFDLASGRVKAALFLNNSFLWNFCLCLICLCRRFFHPSDGLFQLRFGKIGVGEMQSGFSFHSFDTSCGLVVITLYSSVSFGKWSMKGRMVLP